MASGRRRCGWRGHSVGAPDKTGRRQGLRHQGFRGRHPLCRDHAACGAEHPGPPSLRHLRANRSASGLRKVDQRQEADRAGVWLDQTGRRIAATQGQRPIPSGRGVPVARGGLQPDPSDESAQPSRCAGMSGEALRHQRRSSTGLTAQRPRKAARWVEPPCRSGMSMAVTDQNGGAGLGLAAISAAS
jgi:hypothetical protein